MSHGTVPLSLTTASNCVSESRRPRPRHCECYTFVSFVYCVLILTGNCRPTCVVYYSCRSSFITLPPPQTIGFRQRLLLTRTQSGGRHPRHHLCTPPLSHSLRQRVSRWDAPLFCQHITRGSRGVPAYTNECHGNGVTGDGDRHS